MGSLLHYDSANGISLFKNLLRRGPLLDEAGNPRLRSRLLGGLAQSVKDVGRGEGADGDVEATLYRSQRSMLVIATNWRAAGRCYH